MKHLSSCQVIRQLIQHKRGAQIFLLKAIKKHSKNQNGPDHNPFYDKNLQEFQSESDQVTYMLQIQPMPKYSKKNVTCLQIFPQNGYFLVFILGKSSKTKHLAM